MISLRTASLLAAIALLLAPALRAQTPQAPTPGEGRATAFRRAATLTKGINASGWFGGWGDYSPAHTGTWMSPADFQMMHAMGITYIRFGLDPNVFSHFDPEATWKRVDAAIDMALNAGLSVDLCVFPRDDYKQQLSTQHGVDQFTFLWEHIAQHFAGRDPDRIFYELMNESEVQDPYRWIGIQNAVVSAIRTIDTQHTILASGAHWDSLDDLLSTQPLNDTNVIYTFHYYEPYPFTHQGATWSSPEFRYYQNVPFPATVADIQPLLKTVPTDIARYDLYLYASAGWSQEAVNQRIAFAADWSKEHNVPILCNEFGAFRDTAPHDSRARYIRYVRTALENNHIGWAMWDWRGNFGLVTRDGDKITPDPDDVSALGLTMP